MKLLERWPSQTCNKIGKVLLLIFIRWLAELVGISMTHHTEPEARRRKTTRSLGNCTEPRSRGGVGQEPTSTDLKGRLSWEAELTRWRWEAAAEEAAKVCLLQKLEVRNRSEVKIRQDFEIRAGTTNKKRLNCSNKARLPQEVPALVTATRLPPAGSWDKCSLVACRTWRALTWGEGAAKKRAWAPGHWFRQATRPTGQVLFL